MRRYKSLEVFSQSIGANTSIWQYSIVLKGAIIGKNCNINSHCFIEHEVIIGNNVTIKCGVYLWDGITIEDDVFIGPNVTFINDKYPRSKKKFDLLRTTLKRGSTVGAGSIIMAGITIGEYAMIGAASLVTKNIINNTLWFGSPAKQIAFICDCGRRLDEAYHCSACDRSFTFENNMIIR